MSDPLRTRMTRLAQSMPKGDSTRRELLQILAADKSASSSFSVTKGGVGFDWDPAKGLLEVTSGRQEWGSKIPKGLVRGDYTLEPSRGSNSNVEPTEVNAAWHRGALVFEVVTGDGRQETFTLGMS